MGIYLREIQQPKIPLYINFEFGPVEKDENGTIIDGYIGSIDNLGLVCSGKTKHAVIDELVTSIKCWLLFNANLEDGE